MGLWHLVQAAWRAGWQAIRVNASLFTLALIVLMLVEFAYLFVLQNQIQAAATADDMPQAARVLAATLPFTLLLLLVRSALLAPCALAAHRLVLIDPGASHIGTSDTRRLARFTLWLIGLNLLLLTPSSLLGLAPLLRGWGGAFLAGLSSLLLVAALIAALIVSVRLALAYPSIAIDQPAPLAASWQLTRGHWWAIAWACFIVAVPAMLLAAVGALIALALPGTLGMAVRALVAAATAVLITTNGAAMLSLLYRKYGGTAAALWLGA